MDFRRYETLILLSPNLASEQIAAFKNKIEAIINNGQGQIVRIEEWGRRKLAYPVCKELYGYYILYDYRGQNFLAAELERNLKIDEQVFKYLTLILERNFTEEKLNVVLEHLAAEANRNKEQLSSSSEQAYVPHVSSSVDFGDSNDTDDDSYDSSDSDGVYL
ncbi:MAG: 30S ribosomal protein S6 [Deltaproteobacteria bacterium]|jgi:small subunit ribosomal protein S6|nr:30S ribosomal protein S6 [Deltaproteobacteria bacterium]